MNNNNAESIKVMAFGTFDFFHAGHDHYLKEAKSLGTELIVVVARDKTVTKVKGFSPKFSEKKRLKDVSLSPHVDKAILGNEDDKYKVIKKISPNILALGYDQFTFTYGLQKFFLHEKLNIEIKRINSFEPKLFKSSILKK